MNVPFVNLNLQYQSIKQEIDEAVSKVFETGTFVNGRFVSDFEELFAKAYGVKHCISVANGTDAIYICLKMLGIGYGHEVITTACSWISTSEAISQTGATPVFVDIEEDYCHINPQVIASKITNKTKAILPVHLLGQAADMNTIMRIARMHELPVLEDSAQAHFAKLENRNVGLFGLAGTFSFYPSKNLGASGDAGAIITNCEDYANRLRLFARHGANNKHDHIIEGINSRMDEIHAAVLLAKLPHITRWNRLRQQHASYYNFLLLGVAQVSTPKVRSRAEHVFHIYQIRCEQRDALEHFLNSRGIETGRHYPVPLPFLKPYDYQMHRPYDFPIASKYQKEILSLPMFPEIEKNQIEYVVNSIREFYTR